MKARTQKAVPCCIAEVPVPDDVQADVEAGRVALVPMVGGHAEPYALDGDVLVIDLESRNVVEAGAVVVLINDTVRACVVPVVGELVENNDGAFLVEPIRPNEATPALVPGAKVHTRKYLEEHLLGTVVRVLPRSLRPERPARERSMADLALAAFASKRKDRARDLRADGLASGWVRSLVEKLIFVPDSEWGTASDDTPVGMVRGVLLEDEPGVCMHAGDEVIVDVGAPGCEEEILVVQEQRGGEIVGVYLAVARYLCEKWHICSAPSAEDYFCEPLQGGQSTFFIAGVVRRHSPLDGSDDMAAVELNASEAPPLNPPFDIDHERGEAADVQPGSWIHFTATRSTTMSDTGRREVRQYKYVGEILEVTDRTLRIAYLLTRNADNVRLGEWQDGWRPIYDRFTETFLRHRITITGAILDGDATYSDWCRRWKAWTSEKRLTNAWDFRRRHGLLTPQETLDLMRKTIGIDVPASDVAPRRLRLVNDIPAFGRSVGDEILRIDRGLSDLLVGDGLVYWFRKIPDQESLRAGKDGRKIQQVVAGRVTRATKTLLFVEASDGETLRLQKKFLTLDNFELLAVVDWNDVAGQEKETPMTQLLARKRGAGTRKLPRQEFIGGRSRQAAARSEGGTHAAI